MVEFDVNGTNLLDFDKMISCFDEVNALLGKSILPLSTQGGIVFQTASALILRTSNLQSKNAL